MKNKNKSANHTWEYMDEHLFDEEYDQWLDKTMASRPLPEPSKNDFVF